MSWDAIGAIGEVVGAIAVVCTLIYLAIQIREADKTARFNAVQSNREQRIAMFLSERDSPFIPAIRMKIAAGQPLTDEEDLRLARHTSAMWAITYSEWVQNDLALAGEYATSQSEWMKVMTHNARAMSWWDEHGHSVYPERFAQFVESHRDSTA